MKNILILIYFLCYDLQSSYSMMTEQLLLSQPNDRLHNNLIKKTEDLQDAVFHQMEEKLSDDQEPPQSSEEAVDRLGADENY